MKTLNYDQAHDMVSRRRDLFWDGWDIVLWRKNALGATHKRGMYRNGTWGLTQRWSLNRSGEWKVPNKYA